LLAKSYKRQKDGGQKNDYGLLPHAIVNVISKTQVKRHLSVFHFPVLAFVQANLTMPSKIFFFFAHILPVREPHLRPKACR
jgi:hypothetical protein